MTDATFAERHAAARAYYDNLCALAHIKHNLAPKQPTLGYRIDDCGLHWTGKVDLDGERLVGHDAADDRTERAEAKEWLRELLDKQGEIEAEEVKRLSPARRNTLDADDRALLRQAAAPPGFASRSRSCRASGCISGPLGSRVAAAGPSRCGRGR